LPGRYSDGHYDTCAIRAGGPCDCPASDSAATPSPEEFRELLRNFPDLIERLRLRSMGAKANHQMITMALHNEAADAIEELCTALSEDRQLRWHLRTRLDAALSRETT
jgi:hypothetical protein